MGNCLPSCKKRNRVVPLRSYAASSTRTVPRFSPMLSRTKQANLDFCSRGSIRSSKPAAIGKENTIFQNLQITPDLNFTNLASAEDLNDSILINYVRSNSDFGQESGLFERPREPTPKIMKYFYSNRFSEKDIMNQGKTESGLNLKECSTDKYSAHQPIFGTNTDEMEPITPKKVERTVSSTTYIVEYEDSYLRKKEEELSEKRKEENTIELSNIFDCSGESTKLVRSVSEYFGITDEKYFSETASRRDRPRQADYRTRNPRFTDPLIIGDVNDDEFNALFVDVEDEDIELDEAIDYILSDKPIVSSEKPPREASVLEGEARYEDDLDSIAVSEVLTTLSLENEKAEKIVELKSQLSKIVVPGQGNVPFSDPAQKEGELDVLTGTIAPKNSPRVARSGLSKLRSVPGATLASNPKKCRKTDTFAEAKKKPKVLQYYTAEELELMEQIERQF